MKNKNENTNELTFRGWHSDENETFTGVRNDSFGNDCRDHDQDAWNWGEHNNEDFLMYGNE